MTPRNLASLLALACTACSAQPSPGALNLDQAVRLQSLYESACDSYKEYVLPNSHTRPEGFDLEKHLAIMLDRFTREAAQLNDAAGLAYMMGRLRVEQDQLFCSCTAAIIATNLRQAKTSAAKIIETLEALAETSTCAEEGFSIEIEKEGSQINDAAQLFADEPLGI